MATSLGTLVEALKDDLGARVVIVDGSLYSDNQLARTIRAALRYLRGHASDYFNSDWTYASTDGNGNVTVDSTVTPEINVDGRYGAVVMSAAKYQLALAGMVVRAEQNLGNVSTVAGSFSQSSRVSGFRLVAADLKKDLDEQLARLMGGGQHAQASTSVLPTDQVFLTEG